MSGDDLEDALIVGPNSKEHDLFKVRDRYDLVVYYDQSTSNTNHLESSAGSQVLRTLHVALNEFSYRKPLHRPPLLLAGGLDAWIDLLGPQSLTLTTAEVAKGLPAALKSNLYRRWSREVVRAPTPLLLERRADHSPTPPYPISAKDDVQPSIPMPAEPINIEEEQKWLELLKKDSDPLTISVPPEAEDGKKRRRGTSIVANNTGGSLVRTVEEFVSEM
jgi:ubiquitin carboxyl-terminal hydrolase 8